MQLTNERQSGGARKASSRPRERTCVGCGERVSVADAGERTLVRLVLGPAGAVAVDPGDGGFGRGAHVHPRPACLERAVARGLSRSAKARVDGLLTSSSSGLSGGPPREGAEAAEIDSFAEVQPLTSASLAQAIAEAMGRRIQGLLLAAYRARRIVLGAAAVVESCAAGEAKLVLVATDAAAAADLDVVRRAVSSGGAVAWGTKATLGALFGGGADGGREIAVAAITSASLASAVREAAQAADACAGLSSGSSRREAAGRGASDGAAPGRGIAEITGLRRTPGASGTVDAAPDGERGDAPAERGGADGSAESERGA